jgi:hypothetical protein
VDFDEYIQAYQKNKLKLLEVMKYNVVMMEDLNRCRTVSKL